MPNQDDNMLFYQRLMGVGGIAIVVFLVFRIVEPFLAPIAWALFIGFLLQPTQEKVTRFMRGRASVSAFTLTISVLVLFLGPLTAIAIAFARQATELAGRLQVWVGGPQGTSLREIDQIPVVGRLLEWLDSNLQITTTQVQAWLVEGGRNLFQELASYGGIAFLGAVGTVLAFTVMLFILFFIIRDGRAMARLFSTLVPLPADRREALATRVASVTRAVVRGTALTSMIQGLLLGIGFAVVGLPAPVVFGVLAAVLSVVPFGGTALVWVPAAVDAAGAGPVRPGRGHPGRRRHRQQRRQFHQADADLGRLPAADARGFHRRAGRARRFRPDRPLPRSRRHRARARIDRVREGKEALTERGDGALFSK